jgi:hypothetical protein
VPDDPIAFTCTLEARRETVYFEHCDRAGTRRGTRVLGPLGMSTTV